jgi:hypothetical protein
MGKYYRALADVHLLLATRLQFPQTEFWAVRVLMTMLLT